MTKGHAVSAACATHVAGLAAEATLLSPCHLTLQISCTNGSGKLATFGVAHAAAV